MFREAINTFYFYSNRLVGLEIRGNTSKMSYKLLRSYEIAQFLSKSMQIWTDIELDNTRSANIFGQNFEQKPRKSIFPKLFLMDSNMFNGHVIVTKTIKNTSKVISVLL